MAQTGLIVYVSDYCQTSDQLINYLNKHDVSYKIKNVTENIAYLKELQENGIYGTPAAYFVNEEQFILGFQKEKMNCYSPV